MKGIIGDYFDGHITQVSGDDLPAATICLLAVLVK
jgi:hypothetical protein